MFQFKNLGCESLTQGQNGTSAELGKVNGLCHFLAHLIVVGNLACLCEADLHVGVGDSAVLNDGAVAINLEVALIGVDDDIVVLVGAHHLSDDTAEALFEHAHQRGAIDVLCLFELREGFNE